MDDFGTMAGEGQMQGGPRPQDIEAIKADMFQSIPELRGLLVNRLDFMDDSQVGVIEQAVKNRQVAEAMKMLLPEIADIIDQAAGGQSMSQPAPNQNATPMPGQGKVASGGMAPVQGGAEDYEEEAGPVPMPMGGGQGIQPPQAAQRPGPSPLSRIR
jgi:hypothetical protein